MRKKNAGPPSQPGRIGVVTVDLGAEVSAMLDDLVIRVGNMGKCPGLVTRSDVIRSAVQRMFYVFNKPELGVYQHAETDKDPA